MTLFVKRMSGLDVGQPDGACIYRVSKFMCFVCGNSTNE